MSARLAYLDTLKVLLVVGVIAVHSAITYGLDGSWYLESYDEMSAGVVDAVTALLGVGCIFRLGLFFLIAGRLSAPSLNRKGPRLFVKDRLIRLGIPLAAYTLLVSPFLEYVAYRENEHGAEALWPFVREQVWHFAPGPPGSSRHCSCSRSPTRCCVPCAGTHGRPCGGACASQRSPPWRSRSRSALSPSISSSLWDQSSSICSSRCSLSTRSCFPWGLRRGGGVGWRRSRPGCGVAAGSWVRARRWRSPACCCWAGSSTAGPQRTASRAAGTGRPRPAHCWRASSPPASPSGRWRTSGRMRTATSDLWFGGWRHPPTAPSSSIRRCLSASRSLSSRCQCQPS